MFNRETNIMKANGIIGLLISGAITILSGCEKMDKVIPETLTGKPDCIITSPEEGNEYSIGNVIMITVNAADPNGNITEVKFFINDIGTYATSGFPYQYKWETKGLTEGTYKIEVVATDNSGLEQRDQVKVELIYAPGSPCPGIPTVMDGDGNVYNTILIGNQCWMKENLRVGKQIPSYQDQTNNNVIEKWCYDNNSANNNTFGGLYQWDELMRYTGAEGGQGLCPVGWHVPSDKEWKELEGNLDTKYGPYSSEWNKSGIRGMDAGKNAKSSNGWANNGNGPNSNQFNAIPGGCYIVTSIGQFKNKSERAYFWTSSRSNSGNPVERLITSNEDGISRAESIKNTGYSVRCIKD